MCKVELADFSDNIYYYPECPSANTYDVHIKDCLCNKLSNDPGSVGGQYWCSTAHKFNKCPMDVKNG